MNFAIPPSLTKAVVYAIVVVYTPQLNIDAASICRMQLEIERAADKAAIPIVIIGGDPVGIPPVVVIVGLNLDSVA